MNSILKIILIVAYFGIASSTECLFFPREFIARTNVIDKALEKNKCTFENSENVTKRWNEFVQGQINFLLLQQCVTYTNMSVVDKSCKAEVEGTFSPLFGHPLCCNGEDSSDRDCLFQTLDPCQKGEKAGPETSILSSLCKIRDLPVAKSLLPNGSRSADLQLHYYTLGCFNSAQRFGGLRTNLDTIEFLSHELCHQAISGPNCCGGRHGCNLPPLGSYLYSHLGPRELLAKLASNPNLEALLRRWHVSPISLESSLGSPTEYSNGQIFALAFGAGSVLCAAILACAFTVWLCHKRWRKQKNGNNNNKKKKKKQQQQQQKQRPAKRYKDVDGVLPIMPGAFAPSSSASTAAGVGAIDNSDQKKLLTSSTSSGGCSSSLANYSSNSASLSSAPATGSSSLQPHHRQRHHQASAEFSTPSMGSGARQQLSEGLADSLTGSGAGQPILVPRTAAREVALQELIGQGRFGQVFRGVFRNDPVAVKIFSSRAEASWSTEGRVYELPGIRHDSVLGFRAIDNIDVGCETQLWLITDYHGNGSLQNYLTQRTVDQLTLARMAASVANGLAHLHSEILGVSCKPAIAHRDIKSNNVLVKADLTCCIADFGLAVAFHPGGSGVDLTIGGVNQGGPAASAAAGTGEVGGSNRVGTRRYLAPECLDDTQPQGDFTALRKADVYAMGLVFWELTARCEDPSRSVEAEPEYRQPYHDLVSANPTLEEMRAVVCLPRAARPPLSDAWRGHPVLGRMCRVLSECWYKSPAARLEAMSVKDQTSRMLATAEQLAADQSVSVSV